MMMQINSSFYSSLIGGVAGLCTVALPYAASWLPSVLAAPWVAPVGLAVVSAALTGRALRVLYAAHQEQLQQTQDVFVESNQRMRNFLSAPISQNLHVPFQGIQQTPFACRNIAEEVDEEENVLNQSEEHLDNASQTEVNFSQGQTETFEERFEQAMQGLQKSQQELGNSALQLSKKIAEKKIAQEKIQETIHEQAMAQIELGQESQESLKNGFEEIENPNAFQEVDPLEQLFQRIPGLPSSTEAVPKNPLRNIPFGLGSNQSRVGIPNSLNFKETKIPIQVSNVPSLLSVPLENRVFSAEGDPNLFETLLQNNASVVLNALKKFK